MNYPELAALGYDAYGATTGHKNYQGNPMPTWETLPDPQKNAWIMAAAMIRNTVVDALGAGVSVGNMVDRINEIIRSSGVETNLISDGYHTVGELYDHRIENFVALARVYARSFPKKPVWRSLKHSDGELAYGGLWFVLGIGALDGEQITYHLPISRWDDTEFAITADTAPEWDGHTSADVIERLKTL